jgi:hypothetical protein
LPRKADDAGEYFLVPCDIVCRLQEHQMISMNFYGDSDSALNGVGPP